MALAAKRIAFAIFAPATIGILGFDQKINGAANFGRMAVNANCIQGA